MSAVSQEIGQKLVDCELFAPSADKEWRRKYFHEKKLTSSLEEQIKRKKMEIRRVRTQLNRRKEAKIQGERVTCFCSPS